MQTSQLPDSPPYSRPYTADMERAFISTQDLRENLAKALTEAHNGRHKIINRRSEVGYALLVDEGFYVRALKALGEPIPDWAATGD